MGNHCGKILWEILAGKSCGKILQEIFVENLVGNVAGNVLEKVLMVCNGSKNGKNHQHRQFFLSQLQPLKHYQTISIL